MNPHRLADNKVFIWIAVVTAILLLVPLIAMQFTHEVNWSGMDFIVMAVLLFGNASLFVLIARKLPGKHHALVGVICTILFLYLWAELAVGIFTDWGS